MRSSNWEKGKFNLTRVGGKASQEGRFLDTGAASATYPEIPKEFIFPKATESLHSLMLQFLGQLPTCDAKKIEVLLPSPQPIQGET